MARILCVGLATGLATIVLVGCTASSPSPSASDPEPVSGAPSVASEEPSTEPSRPPVSWRELSVEGGPSAREDHTWTVDPDQDIAYLFGGRDATGAALADLWAYDLAADAWSQVAGGPPARFGHNAAWVDGVGLVTFAGQGDGGFFNDLWAYDPAAGTWQQLPDGDDLPVPRYGSCASLGPDGRLWISHGFTSDGARFNDTRAYDFGAGSWTDETPATDLPLIRCLHACWWTDTDRFTLYAGQTNGITALGDRWELTTGPRPGTSSWLEVAFNPSSPPDRNLYAATRWGDGSLVFGGQATDSLWLNDLWRLADDGSTTELTPASGPSARSGSELVADEDHDRVLLFGGTAGTTVFGDLWELTPP